MKIKNPDSFWPMCLWFVLSLGFIIAIHFLLLWEAIKIILSMILLPKNKKNNNDDDVIVKRLSF